MSHAGDTCGAAGPRDEEGAYFRRHILLLHARHQGFCGRVDRKLLHLLRHVHRLDMSLDRRGGARHAERNAALGSIE